MPKSRLTIFRKGLLLISLPLLFQFAFIAFLLGIRADAVQAERMAMHTKEVIASAESAFALLAQGQNAARGFLLTANSVFDTESEATVVKGSIRLKELEKLVSDNPPQVKRVELIRARAEAFGQWLSQQRQMVREGHVAEAIERSKSLTGKRRLDEVREALDPFLAEEDRLDGQRLEAVRKSRVRQGWVLGFGAVAATVIAAAAVRLFAKGVSSRLAVVTTNAALLAENAELAPPVGGQDEIASLDAAMHYAAQQLTAASKAEAAYKSELERRANELAHTNENLRQQTQENEMFVYSVSHDLRSPLVNLQGFSRELVHAGEDLQQILSDERMPDDLRSKAAEVLEKDVQDSVRFIQSAVTRSSSIIDALLRLSRAGRVEYRQQLIPLEPVMGRIVEAMRATIDQKQAEIKIGALEPAWGDAAAVEQIFGNLIGNAVNYLDPNRPGRIELGMVDEGRLDPRGLRTYYVRDNGFGIPEAYLGKMFVAFQRLHGDVAKGEGIGLALVKRVIERHGGKVWVESTAGVGTTFFVSLHGESRPTPISPGRQTTPANEEAEPVAVNT